MTDNSLPPTFKAASDVLRPVIAFSASLVGLTALAIAAGWKVLATYYSEIGASWIIRTESSSSIIQAGVEHVLPAGLFLFIGFLSLAQHSITSVGLRRLSILSLGVGVALCIVPLALPKHLSANSNYALTVLGTLSISACIGLTVAEVIARYSEQGNKWHPYFAWLFYLAAIYGFSWTPSLAGSARARIDMDSTATRLPLVEIEQSSGTMSPRLLSTNGDNAILILLGEKPSSATFRVVSLSQIKVIHSTRRANE